MLTVMFMILLFCFVVCTLRIILFILLFRVWRQMPISQFFDRALCWEGLSKVSCLPSGPNLLSDKMWRKYMRRSSKGKLIHSSYNVIHPSPRSHNFGSYSKNLSTAPKYAYILRIPDKLIYGYQWTALADIWWNFEVVKVTYFILFNCQWC